MMIGTHIPLGNASPTIGRITNNVWIKIDGEFHPDAASNYRVICIANFHHIKIQNTPVEAEGASTQDLRRSGLRANGSILGSGGPSTKDEKEAARCPSCGLSKRSKLNAS
jgi:hypothetical protein